MERKLILFITGLLLCFFFPACKEKDDPEPASEFSYTKQTNCHAPCTVTFTNNSIHADTYEWHFGDSTTSSEKNPVHTFMYGGEFTVKLIAYQTSSGESNILTKKINISNASIQAKITKVTITDVPLKQGSGISWDATEIGIDTMPDIIYYFKTAQTPITTLFGPSLIDTNVQVLPIKWEYSTSNAYVFQNTAFSTEFYVYLYDADNPFPSSIAFMGNTDKFKLSDHLGAYPAQISSAFGGVSVTLDIEWVFN